MYGFFFRDATSPLKSIVIIKLKDRDVPQVHTKWSEAKWLMQIKMHMRWDLIMDEYLHLHTNPSANMA